jgi:hypothetical protein
MSPILLFAVQYTFSLLLSALVAKWYVAPALKKLPLHSALIPLFLFHALRYLPTTAFAPGQIGGAVPRDAMAGIAYGDLGAAVLALVAALFLRYRLPGAIALAWVVNVVASLDWLYASYLAASNHLATHPLGGNWYIAAYYAPALAVVHWLIFARLLAAESSDVEASTARLQGGVR